MIQPTQNGVRFRGRATKKGKNMLEQYGIKIPGVLWGFILLAIGWFLQANFPNEVWLPLVTVVIVSLLKYIEVQTGEDLPDFPAPEGMSHSFVPEPQPRRSKLSQFLIG